MGPFFDPGERQGVPASAVLQGAARRAGSVTAAACDGCPAVPRPPSERSSSICSGSATTGWCSATGCREWCGHGADPRGGHRARERRARPHRPGDACSSSSPARSKGRGATRTRSRISATPSTTATSSSSSCPTATSAVTIVRQFLFDAWSVLLLDGAPTSGRHASSPASRPRRSRKPRYHVRHSGEWVRRARRRHGGESSARADGAGRALALHRRAVRRGRGRPAARGARASASIRRRSSRAWRDSRERRGSPGDAHAADTRVHARAAAARDGTPSTSATCWPRCRSSRARTRGRHGERRAPAPSEALLEVLDAVIGSRGAGAERRRAGDRARRWSSTTDGAVAVDVTPTYSGCPAMHDDRAGDRGRARAPTATTGSSSGRCTRRPGPPTG